MQHDTRFSDLLKLFLLDKSLECSTGTVDHYRQTLNTFSRYIGDIPFTKISHVHCRTFLAEMKQRDLSHHTINGHFRDMRALFNWALSEELLDTSPMARVKFKTPKWEPKKGVNLVSIRAMLKVTDRRDTCIILTLLDTGIRARELCDLKVGDADPLHAGTLIVRRGNWIFDKACLGSVLPSQKCTFKIE